MMDYLSFIGQTAAAIARAAHRALPHPEADFGESAHLNGATSVADLEMRIRELDGPHHGSAYPTNFSTH